MMRLARAGTTISHCPCSNQVLASGCCPACDLERAGVRVDGSNLIQEVRAAFLIQRGRYGVSAVGHRDSLRWATKGSAACIGRPELGEIRAGKIADLALFKLDELRFSGAGDPLAALVLCGAHKADGVMIGGEWVVEDGRIGCLDIDDLARRHSTAARRLQGSEP
jgi:8-oxoguanine deaminase